MMTLPMNKIHLLAPEVAQKIAAGEVIERPVSFWHPTDQLSPYLVRGIHQGARFSFTQYLAPRLLLYCYTTQP